MVDRIADQRDYAARGLPQSAGVLRAGLVAASAAGTALVYRRLNAVNLDTTEMPAIAGLITAPHADGFWVNEAITPRPSIL